MRLDRQDVPLKNHISTLRQKTLIIVSLTVTSLISILYLTTSTLLTQSYAKLEKQHTQEKVERALAAYANSISVLDDLNANWATWDDTYAFVQYPEQSFIEQNLADEASLAANVNIMLLNCSGRCNGAKWLTSGNRINSAPGMLCAIYSACSGLMNSSYSLCTMATGTWISVKSDDGLAWHWPALSGPRPTITEEVSSSKWQTAKGFRFSWRA